MSLNIYFEEVKKVDVHDQNITHNLHPMANQLGLECLWNPEQEGIKCAGDLIKPLEAAVGELIERRDHYSQWDAPNGWGTSYQFLPWLETLLRAAREREGIEMKVFCPKCFQECEADLSTRLSKCCGQPAFIGCSGCGLRLVQLANVIVSDPTQPIQCYRCWKRAMEAKKPKVARPERKVTVISSAIILVVGLATASNRYRLDNYSFSVGVHCAYTAMEQGLAKPPPKSFDNGACYFEWLHAARHLAITNGWPEFNNREGFKGDE